MEVIAKLNNLRIAPRKVGLVAGLIRRLPVRTAETQLRFLNKAASGPMLKLLLSAMANADHNFKLDKETLWVKTCTVNQGTTLKRWRARAFGRAAPIRKRSCHVTLILSDDARPAAKTKRVYKPIKRAVAKPTA